MSKQVKLRRGTTAEMGAFTGAEGELCYNEVTKTLVLHDGVTQGGVKHFNMPTVFLENYGATGDGVTDDSDALQTALATGLPIMLLDKEYSIQQSVSVTDDIELYGAGTLLGTETLDMFLSNGSVSLQINDVTLQHVDTIWKYQGNITEDVTVELRNCKFLDHQYVLRTSSVTAGGGRATLRLINCLHEMYHDKRTTGGRFDYLWTTIPIESCVVSSCTFRNGGWEALNLQGDSKTSSGDYTFVGNTFENYVGHEPGGTDTDVHFIRCYGERATIVGNTFKWLDVTVGTGVGDVEALRPNCHYLTVVGNVFEDAGYQEGWVAAKGCLDTLVASNIFRCTTEYMARANTHGATVYITPILLNAGSKILGNTFENFRFGPCIDCQDVQGVSQGALLIEHNKFNDCVATRYTNATMRLTGDQAEYHIHGNVWYHSDDTDRVENCVRLNDGTSEFYSSNNHYECSDAPFWANSSYRNLYSHGDYCRTNQRLMAGGGDPTYGDLHFIDITLDMPYSVHTVFGELDGSVAASSLILQGKRTCYVPSTVTLNNRRYVSFFVQSSAICKYKYEHTIITGAEDDTAEAIHSTIEGVMHVSSSGVRTDLIDGFDTTLARQGQVFAASPNNSAGRPMYNSSTSGGWLQPTVRDLPAGGGVINVAFDISLVSSVDFSARHP